MSANNDRAEDFIPDDPTSVDLAKTLQWEGKSLAPYSEAARMLWHEITIPMASYRLSGVALIWLLIELQAAFDQSKGEENLRWRLALTAVCRKTADPFIVKAECLEWSLRIGAAGVDKMNEFAKQVMDAATKAEIDAPEIAPGNL